ncbi:MAG: hypothetical protein ACRDUB_00605 [Mycobacterium sp.]
MAGGAVEAAVWFASCAPVLPGVFEDAGASWWPGAEFDVAGPFDDWCPSALRDD